MYFKICTQDVNYEGNADNVSLERKKKLHIRSEFKIILKLFRINNFILIYHY